jgi:tryptophan synthase beta chain
MSSIRPRKGMSAVFFPLPPSHSIQSLEVKMSSQTRFDLPQSELPRRWYNIAADSPIPPTPALHPVTKEPVSPEFLSAIFPNSIIAQEVSTQRYIDIPEPVREIYKLWRPTPLLRAIRLEKALGTPAHIYYKYEGVSPSGSHKSNTAVAQAFYNKEEGVKAMTTETGAGQWGSALSMACKFFGLDLEVYMVRVSYDQKPYRRYLMETYGAKVFASPTELTDSGRAILEKDPQSPGSLGIAISEAVEMAAKSNGQKKYGLGSVLHHVLVHQSIIGEEALKQMELADEYPDIVIGCVGGGSNFAGIAFPFLRENLCSGKNTRLVAVEPTAAPSLTRGLYAYDFGDTAELAPVVKMYTLGHNFIPSAIHAGGLRYHGMAPTLSGLYNAVLLEARAVKQQGVFQAAQYFAQLEGILPAPESAHAIQAAIDEANLAKVEGKKKVILFNLSGHGHFDLAAYDAFHKGKLNDHELSMEEIAGIPEQLPQIPVPA